MQLHVHITENHQHDKNDYEENQKTTLINARF